MSRSLESRLQRLEQRQTQRRLHIVVLQEGEDAEAGKQREGVKPDDDCIIVSFFGAPPTDNCHAQS